MGKPTDEKTETKPLHYAVYLRLDKILNAQEVKSEVHDEHLFIIIHQAHELWFKQIICEVDSVTEILGRDVVDETLLQNVVKRLNRVKMIWHLIIDQILILETMTPLDFMDFRDLLFPASGFQSLQFRIIENKWGIEQADRKGHSQNYAREFSKEEDLTSIKDSKKRSLTEAVQKWLARSPTLNSDKFDLWAMFEESVKKMINDLAAKGADIVDENKQKEHAADIKKRRDKFAAIFDRENFRKYIGKFSYEAFKGALLTCFYRDEPRLAMGHQIIQLLVDIDSVMMRWRYHHSIMVQRMIGTASFGTAGTVGFDYLSSTYSNNYKVFIDLANLAAFLIPQVRLPVLTEEIKQVLRDFPVPGKKKTELEAAVSLDEID